MKAFLTLMILTSTLFLGIGFSVYNSANSVLNSTMKSYTTPQQNSINY